MVKHLRILLVEDTEEDASLLLYTLRREGYEVVYEVVDTPSAMRAALENQDWDVITSDHAMPHFSAPAALALAKELRPDLPFIIVSGEIDLNLAVSLMKQGAQDYIQKREMPRLIPAIKRELHEAEMRREHQRVKETLLASEERFRKLFEHHTAVKLVIDPETGTIIDANEAATNFYGWPIEELKQMRIQQINTLPSEAVKAELEKAASSERTRFEFRHRRADGSIRDVEVFSNKIEITGKHLLHSIIHDITERKLAEEALRESEELLSLFMRHSPVYTYIKEVTRTESRVLQASDNYIQMIGIPGPEMIGKTMEELFPPEFAAKITADDWTVVSSGNVLQQDEDFNGRNYTTIKYPIIRRGKTLLAGYNIDITDRKRAENDLIETMQQLQDTRDMLLQFEKQAIVGRLAAGVAHEILNPAAIIYSRLQFLEEENLAESAREDLRVSREQLQKIVKITRDLHQSSSDQQVYLVYDDFRGVVQVGLQMTEHRIKDDHIQVEYDPPAETIPVKMAINRLVKVMVHLITNACDAMALIQEKRLIITVQYHAVSSQSISMLLIVADNGHGIPTENLNLIFDPFFTTKEPGKGTGLGLSVCRGIIQEHGGTIHAENNDRGGASFIVELPLCQP